MHTTNTFLEFEHICLEAPGTLPDLPGWILGHPIEVEQKSTFCKTHEEVGTCVQNVEIMNI